MVPYEQLKVDLIRPDEQNKKPMVYVGNDERQEPEPITAGHPAILEITKALGTKSLVMSQTSFEDFPLFHIHIISYPYPQGKMVDMFPSVPILFTPFF